MTLNENSSKNRIKNIAAAVAVVLTVMMLDPMLESFYFYTLYTGRFFGQAVTAFHLRMMRLLKILVPAAFAAYLVWKKGRINYGALLPIAGFYALSLVLNYISTGSPERWAASAYCPILILLLITMNMQTKSARARFFRVMTWLYIVLAFLNALFKVFPSLYDLFAEWRNQSFIGGADNSVGIILVTGMLFALLDSYVSGKRTALIIYTVLFYANQILSWSATALVGALVLAIYFIPGLKRLSEKTNFTVMVLISLALFVLLVWLFDVFVNFGPIAFFVNKVLHKSLTLTGRVFIWTGLRQIVMQKPILGYGLGAEPYMYFDDIHNHKLTHAHNAYLQTWYEGGLVQLAAILAILGMTAKKFKSCKDAKLAGIFKIILFVFLIMYQADIPAWFTWYPVFIVIQTAFLMINGEEKHEC